jgi:hypothetical protein
MKKYRSLWCVSTTNHNILYFFCNHCINLVNTANRLWKAWMRQELRGVGRSKMPEFHAIASPRPTLALLTSVALGKGGGKAQERCSLGANCVEKWTKAFNLPADWHRAFAGKVAKVSIFELRLGRDHLLVKDADDTNSSRLQPVEHDVLTDFVPAQA